MNVKKLMTSFSTGAAVLALSAVAVFAAVTFDPEVGGFVGKGDVQTALGMNNNQLQSAVSENLIQFRYSEDVVVEGGACLNPNTGAEHPNDVWERTSGLSATAEYEGRNNKKQLTGFILGSVGSGGDPIYTDACGGNRIPDEGEIISVTEGDGLEVSYDGGEWSPLQ